MRICPGITLPRFLRNAANRSFEQYLSSNLSCVSEGHEFFSGEIDVTDELDLIVETFLSGEYYVVTRAFIKQFADDYEDQIEEMIVRIDPRHSARIFNGDYQLEDVIMDSFYRAVTSVAEFCLKDEEAVRLSILSELSNNGVHVFSRFCELPPDRFFIGDLNFPYMYPAGGSSFRACELVRLRQDLWKILDEADLMQANHFLGERYNTTAAQLGVERAFCYKVAAGDVE